LSGPESLELRRRAVEIARMTRDADGLNAAIEDYAKSLEVAGRMADAEDVRKQAPKP
jgi:hypothetical protein